MSTEKTEIETFFGRCRCCLSYGYLKNMWTEHEFEGDTEIYGEMLVQCFALSFHHSEDAMEQDQICEQCVSRLRDANDFKKVVLDSQEELMQQVDAENQATIKEEIEDDKFLMVYEGPESEGDTADTTYADTEYTAGTGDTSESVKDEMEYEEIEYLEEDDAGETKEVVDTDSSLPTENRSRTVKRRKQAQPDSDEGPIKRKWPKRLPKSERLKTYKQYSEEDLRQCLEAVRNNELTPNEASLKYNIPKKTVCAKMKLDPKDVQSDIPNTNNTTTMRISRTQNKVPTRSTKERTQTKSVEIDATLGKKTEEQNKYLMIKHKQNLKMILKCSNATIIKGNSAAGYSCWFCDEHFSPANLKKHNMKHRDVFDDAIKVKYVSELIIKVDVTGLKCKLCKESMESLEDFLEHLQDEHKKTVYTDIDNHIIPFKFDTENLQCVVCSKEFKYFKLLSEHMSEHYRNYECAECNRAFINKQSMLIHSYRHNKGEFKCSQCPKIFDNRMKVTEHERVTHTLSNKKRKCAYCNEKFSSVDLVKAHEAKKHGAVLPKYNCDACDKIYFSQKTLRNHKKRHHLMIRPFECDDCGRGFFTRQELAWHSATHTKTKDYQCDWCSNAFSTKPALNQHMRAHLGDRKYECKHCKTAYVHLSTWKTHMISQHGERAKYSKKQNLCL